MLLFVIYAIAVWYFVLRSRRTLRGAACLIGGVAGLVVVAWLHYRLQAWTSFDIYLPVLQVILYPYTGMVALIGVFLLSLPTPGCRLCGYDRHGLEEDEICPECGTTVAEAETRAGRRLARKRAAERSVAAPEPVTGIRLSPTEDREHATARENQQRQPKPAGEPQREERAIGHRRDPRHADTLG